MWTKCEIMFLLYFSNIRSDFVLYTRGILKHLLLKTYFCVFYCKWIKFESKMCSWNESNLGGNHISFMHESPIYYKLKNMSLNIIIIEFFKGFSSLLNNIHLGCLKFAFLPLEMKKKTYMEQCFGTHRQTKSWNQTTFIKKCK